MAQPPLHQYSVCIIGAGPGGYVAAIRCAQLGIKTALVEQKYLGGVCLNVGCIPSKAMISASHFFHRLQSDAPQMGIMVQKPVVDLKEMKRWKNSVSQKMAAGVESLLKANQVTVLKGSAEFVSAHEISITGPHGTSRLTASHFIIAIGSRPQSIPGFDIDESNILSSTGALDLEVVPKSLAVIGGGYIGLEIGSYLAKFGCAVTIIENTPQLLSGLVDADILQVLSKKLKKHKVQVLFNTRAMGYKKITSGSGSGSGFHFQLILESESAAHVSVEKILVTVGRKPNSDLMNLAKVGIKVEPSGFIKVDSQRRTSVPHIFAIGDIAGQPMLAHKASHEGVMVAEILGGQNRVFDAKTVPAVIFTDPEVASVGWTEDQCHANGYASLSVGKFPFAASGRAVSLMETEGFVKIIADQSSHVILGVHIVGPEASHLISEAALAIEMGARLEDLALTIHPHPTLSETLMEAAEAALGHAIHIIQKPLHRPNGRPQLQQPS